MKPKRPRIKERILLATSRDNYILKKLDCKGETQIKMLHGISFDGRKKENKNI